MRTGPLIEQLRAIEDIRTLKARYFHSCDRKDPEGLRDCFVAGAAWIDYGDLGCFDHRDKLVDCFRRLGCHDHLVEMHHGSNPQVEILDAHHALGSWSLYYQRIDTREQTLTQLGGWYEDTYLKEDGRWRIAQTRCVIDSRLVLPLAGAGVGIHPPGRTLLPTPQPRDCA